MIFDRVLDGLGAAVVDGSLPTGHRDSIDGFVTRTGSSRSIVREAVAASVTNAPVSWWVTHVSTVVTACALLVASGPTAAP